MCGRYASVASTSDLVSEFGVDEVAGDDLPASWNVAPTDHVRIIVDGRRGPAPGAAPARQLRTARWGLAPHWAATGAPNASMINARSETVSSKPAFAAAAARRRCLVPALGYYEWKREDGRKIPHFLHAPTGRVLAMAGIYAVRRDDSLPEGHPDRRSYTCAVITRPATDLLGEIHDRCPVLVPAQSWSEWLDCTVIGPGVVDRLIASLPEPHLEPYRVSPAVGNVRNNGPQLIAPIDADAPDVLPLL